MAPAWWESGFFGAFYISREETIYIKISAESSFVSVFAQPSIVQPGKSARDEQKIFVEKYIRARIFKILLIKF